MIGIYLINYTNGRHIIMDTSVIELELYTRPLTHK